MIYRDIYMALPIHHEVHGKVHGTKSLYGQNQSQSVNLSIL